MKDFGQLNNELLQILKKDLTDGASVASTESDMCDLIGADFLGLLGYSRFKCTKLTYGTGCSYLAEKQVEEEKYNVVFAFRPQGKLKGECEDHHRIEEYVSGLDLCTVVIVTDGTEYIGFTQCGKHEDGSAKFEAICKNLKGISEDDKLLNAVKYDSEATFEDVLNSFLVVADGNEESEILQELREEVRYWNNMYIEATKRNELLEQQYNEQKESYKTRSAESTEQTTSSNNEVVAKLRDKIVELNDTLAELRDKIADKDKKLKEAQEEIDSFGDKNRKEANTMLSLIKDTEEVSRKYIGVINHELFQCETLEKFVGIAIQKLYEIKKTGAMSIAFDGDMFQYTSLPSDSENYHMFIANKKYNVELNEMPEDEAFNRLSIIFSNFTDLVFECKKIGKLVRNPDTEAETVEEKNERLNKLMNGNEDTEADIENLNLDKLSDSITPEEEIEDFVEEDEPVEEIVEVIDEVEETESVESETEGTETEEVVEFEETESAEEETEDTTSICDEPATIETEAIENVDETSGVPEEAYEELEHSIDEDSGLVNNIDDLGFQFDNEVDNSNEVETVAENDYSGDNLGDNEVGSEEATEELEELVDVEETEFEELEADSTSTEEEFDSEVSENSQEVEEDSAFESEDGSEQGLYEADLGTVDSENDIDVSEENEEEVESLVEEDDSVAFDKLPKELQKFISEEDDLDSNFEETTDTEESESVNESEDTEEDYLEDGEYKEDGVEYEEESDVEETEASEEDEGSTVVNNSTLNMLAVCNLADMTELLYGEDANSVDIYNIKYLGNDDMSFYINASGIEMPLDKMASKTIDAIYALLIESGETELLERITQSELGGISNFIRLAGTGEVSQSRITKTQYVISGITSVTNVIACVRSFCSKFELDESHIWLYMEASTNSEEMYEKYMYDEDLVSLRNTTKYVKSNKGKPETFNIVLQGNITDKVIFTKNSMVAHAELIENCLAVKLPYAQTATQSFDDFARLYGAMINHAKEAGVEIDENEIGNAINSPYKIISRGTEELAEEKFIVKNDDIEDVWCASQLEQWQYVYAVIKMYSVIHKSKKLAIKVAIDADAFDFYRNRFETCEPSLSIAVYTITEYIASKRQ